MNNETVVQQMPSMAILISKDITIEEYLRYYKNIWTRNTVARTIDMQTDIALKAEDPEQIVTADDQRQIPVKERLELRKILVQDALNLLKSIDTMIAMGDEFVAKNWSEEALAVADDMLPKLPVDQGLVKYKVTRDFGEVKAGDVISCETGWTTEQIQEKIADGTFEVFTEDKKPTSEEAKI